MPKELDLGGRTFEVLADHGTSLVLADERGTWCVPVGSTGIIDPERIKFLR